MIDVMFAPGGGYRPLPWRVCTRMIGTTLGFKIWFPAVMSEPAWNDPAYTRTATVPAAWIVPGKAGWYAGHLPPGGRARYTGLSVWSLA